MQTVSWRIRILRAAAIGFALCALGFYIWLQDMAARTSTKRAERASSSKVRLVSDAILPRTRHASTKSNRANIFEIYRQATGTNRLQHKEPEGASSPLKIRQGNAEHQRAIDEIDAWLRGEDKEDSPFNGKKIRLMNPSDDKDQP